VSVALAQDPAWDLEHDLAAEDAMLNGAPADEIVAWAVDRFGGGVTLAASFSDCVLIDVATRVAPDLDVVFLDTQYHFPETRRYLEQVRDRYGLRLRVVRPRVAMDDRFRADPDGCCTVRKVEPLERALAGRAAWMSGLRRAEAPSRAHAQVVAWDARRRLVKVNPLAAWTDADVGAYVRAHELPRHPLTDRGFPSIGCWPCTRAPQPGEDLRAGRWAGSGKTECGINT
jgi:phosphoadenosine phosphosulfate reductase